MKLSATKEMRLRNVTAADLDWRRAKKEARAVGRKAEAEYIQTFAFERDRAVRLAIGDGVPKNQLLQSHQGLHTTAPVTLRESLERTESAAGTIKAEEVDPLAMRYSLSAAGELVVWLAPAELEAAMRAVNFDASETVAPDTARFTAQGGRLVASTGVTVPGSYERHPVVAWAFEPENEAEALAWLAEQGQEVAA